MPRHIMTDPALYAELESRVAEYDARGRTRSASLLLWFLTTVYRLDEVEAADAVCDRRHDEGFDAIAVNDIRHEIILFQAKRKETLPSTLGDVDLRNFVGSLKKLASEASVRKLIAATPNEELRLLLTDLKVPEKIGAGYSKKMIFVCNVAANTDAKRYLEALKAAGTEIDVWDLTRLEAVLIQMRRDWFVTQAVKLRLNAKQYFYFGASKALPDLVYTAVRARELVKLPGIEDCRLFAQNVRLGLGSTRVNDDILASVKNKKEHKDFILFHNGLTIVAKEIKVRGKTIYLNDFSVCNGCQSLLAFHENRKIISDDLQVLVRIVRVGGDRRLSETIAYRTNNQNAISLRDLSSNDTTQVRLKAEFDSLFGEEVIYSIKRGEESGIRELPNELAGRYLLALYVREPWSAHQKYKIFGELESKIFDYNVDASHIRFGDIVFQCIKDHLDEIENERMGKYGLTIFIILYLVGEILRSSNQGSDILDSPLKYIDKNGTKNTKQDALLDIINNLIGWIIIELNYLAKERGGDSYDYKRIFKSQRAVESIRDELLKAFDKDKHKGRAVELLIK